MPAGQRAVFLDRDGVIVREEDYLDSVDRLDVLPGAARAMRSLRAAGFKIVVVTNQSGVARGYFSLHRLREIHRELRRRLARSGARWDALYVSPHGPESGHPWRKPGIGMLQAARRRFKIDFRSSYLVGDSTADILCARRAGCLPVLVRTGKGGRDGKHRAEPEAVCRDLAAAARWILAREKRSQGRL